MPRDFKQAIDEVLATLYANDARGYMGVDAKVLTDEAKKRISRTLATLDPRDRKTLEDEASYRLRHFEKFSHLPQADRERIIKEARVHDQLIEKAYEQIPTRESAERAPGEAKTPAKKATSAKPKK